ncbi:MAG: hypothetical protein ACPL25_10640 [Ignavibacteria bacterium]
MNDKITLYPASWLYNAGVVGLIQTKSEFFEFQENLVVMDKNIFQRIDFEDYFDINRIINLKGKNEFYPNFIDTQGNQIEIFKKFISSFNGLIQSGYCHICGNAFNISKDVFQEIYESSDAGKNFLSKIQNFDMIYNSLLGPSTSKFPNGVWNLDQSLEVCNLCSFILIHHHLSYTKLSDGTKIFINAPSFRLMYELNRLIKNLYGQDSSQNIPVREILATSVIEYSRKLSALFSKWLVANIEVVIKTNDKIDFFSLPAEVSILISDRNISALLASIGESKILNLVLDQNYSELIDYGYDFLKIGLKENKSLSKLDKELINNVIKRESNKQNITLFADKLFTLYSLIEEKLKENKKWNYRN